LIVRTIDICVFGFFESHLTSPTTLHPRGIRAGSNYGQTLRGEAFGPMFGENRRLVTNEPVGLAKKPDIEGCSRMGIRSI
jgi:hypothetical protein